MWAYVYTEFEKMENLRPIFFNCVAKCLPNEEIMWTNFSTKVLRDTMVFNYFFGMLIGIFLNKEAVFSYRGLYTDKNIKKYILRLFLLIVFLSPFLL